MPESVFDIICPVCGGDVELLPAGEGACRACGAQYLVRIGHLIPVARPPLDPSVRTRAGR